MSGATAKSKPTASKIDDKELSRLRTKDYWLQVSRAKLVMDLIFVCMWSSSDILVVFWLMSGHSIRHIQDQTRRRTRQGRHWSNGSHLEVSIMLRSYVVDISDNCAKFRQVI